MQDRHVGGLGRIHALDMRDLGYQARALLDLEAPPVLPMPLFRYWSTRSLPLDQGRTPMCVAYATRGLLNAGPVVNLSGPPPAIIYAKARELDELPGTDYDGTTARGAMKYLQQLGLISEYVWAIDVPTIDEWVRSRGPMLLGCSWPASFDEPDADGVLRYPLGTRIRGGHEVLVIGANSKRGMLRIMNSWGARYGQHGKVWMPYEVADRLLRDDGDAVTPSEIRVPGAVPNPDETG